MDTSLREALARLDTAIAAQESKLDELRRMRSAADLLWQFVAGDTDTMSDHATAVLTPEPVPDRATRTTEPGASAAVESVMDKSGSVQSLDEIWTAIQGAGHDDELDRAQVRGGLYYLKRVGRVELVRRGHWRWLAETSEATAGTVASEPVRSPRGGGDSSHAAIPEADLDPGVLDRPDGGDRVGASVVP